MNLNQQTTMSIAQNRIVPDSETPIYNDNLGGGSNIVEPEIVTPISIPEVAPVKGGTITNIEQVEAGLEAPTTISNQDVKEPSATTDDTKIYGGGGTTPNSNIIINKPKPNYLVYGIVGVIGILVVYKLFFKGKK